MGARVERFDRRFEDGLRLDLDALRRARHAAHAPDHRHVAAQSVGRAIIDDERSSRSDDSRSDVRRARAGRRGLSGRREPRGRRRPAAASPAATLDGPLSSTNSLTKSYGLAGLRSGWAIAPPDVAPRAAAHARRRRQRRAARRRTGSRRSRSARWPQLAERARATARRQPRARARVLRGASRARDSPEPPACSVVFPRLLGLADADAVRAAAARRPRRRRRARTLLRCARALPPQPRGPPGGARARPRAAGRGARRSRSVSFDLHALAQSRRRRARRPRRRHRARMERARRADRARASPACGRSRCSASSSGLCRLAVDGGRAGARGDPARRARRARRRRLPRREPSRRRRHDRSRGVRRPGRGRPRGRGHARASPSGIIAVTFLLLVEKTRLHALVSKLDRDEIRAAARFAVMAAVILPLLPEGPFGPLGGIRPRLLWALVLFFSGLSFLGYLARRTFGRSRGYALAGTLGGIVSSTSARRSRSRGSAATKPRGRSRAGRRRAGRQRRAVSARADRDAWCSRRRWPPRSGRRCVAAGRDRHRADLRGLARRRHGAGRRRRTTATRCSSARRSRWR